MRMFDAWQPATVPRVVVAAFRAAGFVPVGRGDELYLEIDLSKATRIRQWTEAPHVEEAVAGAGRGTDPIGGESPSINATFGSMLERLTCFLLSSHSVDWNL
jgi:hypothetical protein